MDLLILVSLNVFLLVLFYMTDVIPEYLKLFGADRLSSFKITEYFESLKSPLVLQTNYFEFLDTQYDSFLFRLLACPFCFNFWLTLINTLLFSYFCYLPTIYVFSLLLFFTLKKVSS